MHVVRTSQQLSLLTNILNFLLWHLLCFLCVHLCFWVVHKRKYFYPNSFSLGGWIVQCLSKVLNELPARIVTMYNQASSLFGLCHYQDLVIVGAYSLLPHPGMQEHLPKHALFSTQCSTIIILPNFCGVQLEREKKHQSLSNQAQHLHSSHVVPCWERGNHL